MKTSIKTTIYAVIIGIIVMVLTDLISAHIISSFFTLPFSVFLGALVAGYIIVKRAWLVAISLAVTNSVISLVIYIVLGAGEVTLYQAMFYPVVFYFAAGFLGAFIGGQFGVRFNKRGENVSA